MDRSVEGMPKTTPVAIPSDETAASSPASQPAHTAFRASRHPWSGLEPHSAAGAQFPALPMNSHALEWLAGQTRAYSAKGHGSTLEHGRLPGRRQNKPMTSPVFEAVSQVLTTKFQVDADLVVPDARLAALGLDSLTLMEFVFAVEDHFSIRIPEERLDPRQVELTLADVCRAIEEALPQGQAAAPAGSVNAPDSGRT
jgi:acyl carrier protein